MNNHANLQSDVPAAAEGPVARHRNALLRSAPSVRLDGIAWLLLVVLICWLGMFARLTIQRVGLGLTHPLFQLDNEEGALLFQSLEIKQGRLPYRPIDSPPFMVGTYPPLYLIISALLTSTAEPSFFGGRLVTAVALASCVLSLALITGWLTRSLFALLLAPLLFLVTFEVWSWSPYFRVDFLALALSLLGVTTAVIGSQSRVGQYAPPLLFAMALLTKQTAIAAPLAFLFVHFLRERKRALKHCIVFAAAIGIPVLLLSMLTRGQYLVHTVIYNANKMNWSDLQIWARHLARFYPMWGILCLASLIILLRFVLLLHHGRLLTPTDPSVGSYRTSEDLSAERPRNQADALEVRTYHANECEKADQTFGCKLILCYFVIALINIVGIAKAGSAENYLLEPLAAAALLVGVALGMAYPTGRGSDVVDPLFKKFLLIFLIAHAVRLTHVWPMMFSAGRNPSPQDFRNAAAVTQRLRVADGGVVSELGGYALFAKKEFLFQPFIMSELARQGRWDQTHFVEELRQGKISLIVATVDLAGQDYTDAFTPEMRDAIRQAYECRERFLDGRLWRHYLFYPRKVASPAIPESGQLK